MSTVTPALMASAAPICPEAVIMSRSKARSKGHHTYSKISLKLRGATGGLGMPRDSAEYKWVCAQAKPGSTTQPEASTVFLSAGKRPEEGPESESSPSSGRLSVESISKTFLRQERVARSAE